LSILAVFACHDKVHLYISDFIVQNFLFFLNSLRQGGKKMPPDKIADMSPDTNSRQPLAPSPYTVLTMPACAATPLIRI